MKKKISWLELILVLVIVAIVVKGWGYWGKGEKNPEITTPEEKTTNPIAFNTPSKIILNNSEKDIVHIILRNIKKGDIKAVGEVIDKNPDIINKYEEFLHAAARYNQKEIILLLIEKGANVNARGGDGRTPLHNVVIHLYEDSREVIFSLLEKGAQINAQSNGGYTPIHFAAVVSNKEAVAALLEKGADVNTSNRWGKKAISILRNDEMKDLLCKYKIN